MDKYLPKPEQWAQIQKEIRTLANQEYPKEACGFIMLNEELRGIEGDMYVISVRNIAEWPYAQFRIAEDDVQWVANTNRCVGVWHTHPSDPAVPSELDEEQAVPGIYFVIYSVMDEDLAVFVRDEQGRLVPETIVMPA